MAFKRAFAMALLLPMASAEAAVDAAAASAIAAASTTAYATANATDAAAGAAAPSPAVLSPSLRGVAAPPLALSSATAGAQQCTASWAHDCRSNPTCCEAGFTCFQKTPNWAACLRTCRPHAEQPNDRGLWTCEVLGGHGGSHNSGGGGGVGSAPAPTAAPAPTTAPAPAPPCEDQNQYCRAWAVNQECRLNPGYMNVKCTKSCGLCD